MKLKSLVVAMSLLATGAASFAVTNVGTLTETPPYTIKWDIGSGYSEFDFSFTLEAPATVSGIVSSTNQFGTFPGIGIQVNNTPVIDFNALDGFSFSGLAAGTYTGKLGVNSFGRSTLELSVTAITTPVPEPETYAMMLAGLAALGFLARRRQG